MTLLERKYFPLWQLGYRSNPFRALTPEEWHMLALLPDSMQDLLDAPPALTQILGDQGTGKTSLLLALERGYLEKGWNVTYEYLPVGATRYKSVLSDVRILLLDEAQRLSRSALRRLFSFLGSGTNDGFQLVLSSHSDLTAYAAEHEISLTSVHLDTRSQSFIHALVEHRLSYFERPGHQGTRLTRAALKQLTGHCGPDLRTLEKLLYEAYQTWDAEGSISEKHIKGLINELV